MTIAKKCTKCGEVKSAPDFTKGSNACRVCLRAQQNALKAAKRTKVRTAPEAPQDPVYDVYVPKPELGYFIRNNGLKHVPSRGYI